MKNSQGVNDFAKQKQNFIHIYKAKDNKQSVLHVATDNRDKINTNSPKKEPDTSLNLM